MATAMADGRKGEKIVLLVAGHQCATCKSGLDETYLAQGIRKQQPGHASLPFLPFYIALHLFHVHTLPRRGYFSLNGSRQESATTYKVISIQTQTRTNTFTGHCFYIYLTNIDLITLTLRR